MSSTTTLVNRYILNIPRNNFIAFSIIIIFIALIALYATFTTRSNVIKEGFADIVNVIESTLSYPGIFKTTQYVNNTEKCEFCSDATLF